MTGTIAPQQPGHAPGWKWRASSARAVERPWGEDRLAHVNGLCETGWHTDCPQAPLDEPAANGQCSCPCHLTCGWFALCTNSAHGHVAHPVLGPVPTCTRCATRMDLTFITDQES